MDHGETQLLNNCGTELENFSILNISNIIKELKNIKQRN